MLLSCAAPQPQRQGLYCVLDGFYAEIMGELFESGKMHSWNQWCTPAPRAIFFVCNFLRSQNQSWTRNTTKPIIFYSSTCHTEIMCIPSHFPSISSIAWENEQISNLVSVPPVLLRIESKKCCFLPFCLLLFLNCWFSAFPILFWNEISKECQIQRF